MTPMTTGKDRPMIEGIDICKSYAGRTVLDGIAFTVGKGEMYGVIGPNGSGKSTLLNILSGIERPDRGTVLLNGKDVARCSRRELARTMAVLRQEPLPPSGFTVRETVEMGRYPYQNWLGYESEDSSPLIDRILAGLGISALQRRTLAQISGGERQRTALAKTMAQTPAVLLLDEPTAYLDIGHQIQILDYIRRRQRADGLTVVAVLHDLNLAALYCDRLLLLDRGRAAAEGAPESVLNRELLARVYGAEPALVPHPELGVPQILPRRGADDG